LQGLYGATSSKNSHPFKVIDHDNVSIKSGASSAARAFNVNQQSSTSGGASSLSTQSAVFPSFSNNSHSNQSTAQLSPKQSTLKYKFSSPTKSESVSNIMPPPPNPLPISGSSKTMNILEPDLVASCLSSSEASLKTDTVTSGNPFVPVAPPRRKRKENLSTASSIDTSRATSLPPDAIPVFIPKETEVPLCSGVATETNKFHRPHPLNLQQSSSSSCDPFSSGGSGSSSGFTYQQIQSPKQGLPSPTVSIKSMSRDLEKALDMANNAQRNWVVKAQDEEKTKARTSGPRTLKRTESLPKDVVSSLDGSGSFKGSNSDSNSNTSTLNSSIGFTPHGAQGEGSGSLPLAATGSMGGVNLCTAGQSASTLIACLAAMEEQREAAKSNSGGRSKSISQSNISAAEEQLLLLRTRTNSGRLLSDMEILEQVTVSKSLGSFTTICYGFEFSIRVVWS